RGGAAVDVGGHGQDRGGGGDARAADAGEDDVAHAGELFERRQRGGVGGGRRQGRGHSGLAALKGHGRGAEAVDAGVVLVAGRLVDLALAAELGGERLDRDAVAGRRAVAAAFADQGIDEDALGRLFGRAALAATPALGGADLIVDQHG